MNALIFVLETGEEGALPRLSLYQVTFYRQALRDDNSIGKPQIALKLPFTFQLIYQGNAFDFSPDLSTVVYARPGGQADLYLLSQPQ